MGREGLLIMFRGANKVTLDAKGRMAIPTRFRERIQTRSEGRLVATIDPDHCLLIYALPDWEDVERRLMKLPGTKPKIRQLQRLMVGHASEMELDSHGRVLVPRELREFAGLEKQAMLIGQGNKFELWDESRWSDRREEWLAEEDAGDDLPEELASLLL